jgi:hypothetical protein
MRLDDPTALPDTAVTTAARAFVFGNESAALAHHSVRSYLFAQLRARHIEAVDGRDFDGKLLFLACVLHDIGLSELGNGDHRFEVDGADAAATFLTTQGLPSGDVDAVWEAIALHTSPGIAERRGALCEMTRSGVAMDLGRDIDFVTDAQAAAIHRAYPRLSVERALVDSIVKQVTARPEKGPRYSLPGDLARERALPPHVTGIEQGGAQSRWNR